jgi:hypothetical protein
LTAVHPVLDFVFPYESKWSVFGFRRSLYDAIVFVCALGVALARPRLGRGSLALFASAAAIQVAYVALAALLGLELRARYFVALFVPLSVAVYSLYDAVRQGPRPAFAFAFAPSVALIIVASVARYSVLAQDGDWVRVAPFLQSNVRAGDVIAIYPPDALPAFTRQYHGSAPVVPFPRPASREHYSVREVSVGSEAEARAAFAKLARYPRIWFVDAQECSSDLPLYGCDLLDDVLDDDYRILARHQFFGSTVDELTPRERSSANAAQRVSRRTAAAGDRVDEARSSGGRSSPSPRRTQCMKLCARALRQISPGERSKRT